MRKLKYIFLGILLFSYSSLFSFSTEALIKEAKSLRIANLPYWSKLLHYENNKSIINNQEFFLSKDGKTDLEDELVQTIQYFQDDSKYICKYPARYKWLNSKLDLNITNKNCHELDDFLKPAFKNISIVFTTERYNSPASVFGHTFIKLESNTIPYVIDYTAKVPDRINSFMYAYNGLTGKYKSKYKLMSFFYKDYEYRNSEFRDLMNFNLEFNEDEINNILLHLFEIKNTDQDYYFISRNCSSELIKLLDMGSYNTQLSNDLDLVTLPIDIVYILKKHNLVREISTQISKLKLFYKYIDKLPAIEIKILEDIVSHRLGVKKFYEMKGLSNSSKEIIILAAIEYIEIQSTMDEELNSKYLYSINANSRC